MNSLTAARVFSPNFVADVAMLYLALGAARCSPGAPGLLGAARCSPGTPGLTRSYVAVANAAAPQLGQESLPDLGRSVSTTLATAREQVARAMPLIDVPRHEAAIADLESRSSMADLWDDVASAEATLRELSEHRAEVERSVKWARTLEDADCESHPSLWIKVTVLTQNRNF